MKPFAMRIYRHALPLFLLPYICAGCVMHFKTSPVVTGAVVDNLAGRPIRGAIVTVIPGKGLVLKGPLMSGITKADGRFKVPSGGQFVFPVLLMPVIDTNPDSIAFQKRGYEPLVVPLWWEDASVSTNLGIIRLPKKPAF